MDELLKIDALTYRRNWRTVLADINLTLPRRRIVGVLGANGAGKTTLMRLIAGVAGGVRGGISVAGATTAAARKAHVSASFALVDADRHQRVSQLAAFWAANYPDFDPQRFDALATAMALPLTQRMTALSKGNRVKVQVALTLARVTDLYLLDEPFDGIDSMTRKMLTTSILQWLPEEATMLIADHHVTDIANLLDSVVILKDTRIVAQVDTDMIRAAKQQTVEAFYESYYTEVHA